MKSGKATPSLILENADAPGIKPAVSPCLNSDDFLLFLRLRFPSGTTGCPDRETAKVRRASLFRRLVTTQSAPGRTALAPSEGIFLKISRVLPEEISLCGECHRQQNAMMASEEGHLAFFVVPEQRERIPGGSKISLKSSPPRPSDEGIVFIRTAGTRPSGALAFFISR
jgi:hypothetical protein